MTHNHVVTCHTVLPHTGHHTTHTIMRAHAHTHTHTHDTQTLLYMLFISATVNYRLAKTRLLTKGHSLTFIVDYNDLFKHSAIFLDPQHIVSAS